MVKDDDNNYYEVSGNKLRRPSNSAPIFMQKIAVEPTNKNFIQVGVIGYRDEKSKHFEKSKPIFKRWTKELEDSERKMLENFAEAIVPDVFKMIELSEKTDEDLEKHIAEMEKQKDKKLKSAKHHYEKEIYKIETEFNHEIGYAKKQLAKNRGSEDI